MNNQLLTEIHIAVARLREQADAIERLCPAGSGAATGYAGREADEVPDDAEARSEESRAVTPVKGEEMIKRMVAEADKCTTGGEGKRVLEVGMQDMRQIGKGEGLRIAIKIAAEYFPLTPRPASERSERAA